MLTVTTAATEFNLINVSVVREALSILDQGEDAALSRLISRASDVIALECNRVFALETVAEQFRFDRCRSDELILSRYPVVEITSIVENDITLATSDYEIDKKTGIIIRLSNDRPWQWPARSKIVVTYSSGFNLPLAAPAALQQACIQLVKSYYVGADRDPMMRSETVDQLSSASYFDADMPPDVLGLLTQFRNTRAG